MIKEKLHLWQKTSLRIGEFFSNRLPFSPVIYTITSLCAAAFAVVFSYYHAYTISIILFLIAGGCDVIDGAVARAQNKASNLGAFIDGVTDRFVDFAIIFSYFFFIIQPIWLSIEQWICITSFVVILPSFIVAYANHRGAVDDDNETLIWRLMNRGEMFFFMMAIQISSLFSPAIAGYLLVLLIFLSVTTILQTIIATLYYALAPERPSRANANTSARTINSNSI